MLWHLLPQRLPKGFTSTLRTFGSHPETHPLPGTGRKKLFTGGIQRRQGRASTATHLGHGGEHKIRLGNFYVQKQLCFGFCIALRMGHFIHPYPQVPASHREHGWQLPFPPPFPTQRVLVWGKMPRPGCRLGESTGREARGGLDVLGTVCPDRWPLRFISIGSVSLASSWLSVTLPAPGCPSPIPPSITHNGDDVLMFFL